MSNAGHAFQQGLTKRSSNCAGQASVFDEILSFGEELLDHVVDPKDAKKNIPCTPATRMNDAKFSGALP